VSSSSVAVNNRLLYEIHTCEWDCVQQYISVRNGVFVLRSRLFVCVCVWACVQLPNMEHYIYSKDEFYATVIRVFILKTSLLVLRLVGLRTRIKMVGILSTGVLGRYALMICFEIVYVTWFIIVFFISVLSSNVQCEFVYQM